jgi:hypothetical protein
MAADEHDIAPELELWTINKVAKLASLSHWSIRRDIDAGYLSAVYLGHRIRIRRVEAERYLREGWRREP